MNIIGRYFIISMKKNFAYPVNGVMVIVDTLIDCFSVWLFWISLLELDLSFTQWNRTHLLLFMGFSLISMSISNLFVGCGDLGLHIQKGTLDSYLTKPSYSLLLIALDRANFLRFIVSYLIGTILCIRILSIRKIGYFLIGMLVCIVATIGIECYNLLIIELAFFFKKTDTLGEIISTFFGISKYPLVFLHRALKQILTMVIPLSFIATIPTEMVMGTWNWKLLLILPTNLIFIIGVLVIIWKKGREKYESSN